MKAVLISIQPKWVEKIASGEKTIEVRKSVPKLKRPFKCYIYETKGEYKTGTGIFAYGIELKGTKKGRGKVIGEFVCRGMMDGGSKLLPKQSCLTIDEILDYAKGKRVYGWRIADLKIYDKPKELSEFYIQCNEYCKTGTIYAPKKCCKCKYQYTWDLASKCRIDGKQPLKRPPQSWCYVELQNG